jgi:hypothetical protein
LAVVAVVGTARADFVSVVVSGDGGTGTAKIRPTLPNAADIALNFTDGAGTIAVTGQMNSGGPFAFEETITNHTGYTWTGFSFTVAVPPGGALSYVNGRSAFSSDNIDNSALSAVVENGSVPNGSSFFADINFYGTNSFPLLSSPQPALEVVPEPSGLALFALGLSVISLWCARRRVRRA